MSDFLYLSVKGHPWARNVLSARGAAGQGRQHMDYNMFHNRLTAAVIVYQLEIAADQTNPVSLSLTPTYYGSTYANPRIPPKRRVSSHSLHQKNLRPPNRIKGKLKASQLTALKQRTKCNACHEYGHWRQECPKRRSTPITEIAKARIVQRGNNDRAVAEVLWEMLQEEEEYDAYVTLSDNVVIEELSSQDSSTNEFTALYTSVYNGEEAKTDLSNAFDALTLSNNLDNQAFSSPMK